MSSSSECTMVDDAIAAYTLRAGEAVLCCMDLARRAAPGCDPVPTALVAVAALSPARDIDASWAVAQDLVGLVEEEGAAVESVAAAIRAMPFNLRSLDLRGIAAADEAVRCLAAAFADAPHHQYLRELRLQFFPVDPYVVAQLLDALRGVRRLRSLGIADGYGNDASEWIVWTPFAAACPAACRVRICHGWNPRVAAAVRGDSTAVAREIGTGASAAMQAERLLCFAAHNGCCDVLRMLLAAGAAVETRDRRGRSALHHAAMAGQTGALQLLLAAGAALQGVCDSNHSALKFAAQNGHVDAAAVLLAAGADVTIRDNCVVGLTALMDAASHGHVAVVSLLIDAGAAVDAVDYDINTALMHAVNENHVEAATVLLAAGANPVAENRDGNASIGLAQGGDWSAAMTVLLRRAKQQWRSTHSKRIRN
jgi:hypothetical protein